MICAIERPKRLFALVLLLNGLFCLPGLASGAWYKHPQEILAPPAKTGFEPSYVLLKTGVFSQNGYFRPSHPQTLLDHFCRARPPHVRRVSAWVTHRLSPGKTLSPKAGAHLAEQINRLLASKCFSSVELDIEPLPSPPTWLGPFLDGLRKKLSRSLKLTLAIPPVTQKQLPGLSWSPSQAAQVLEHVDGLDLMIYDTGLQQLKHYTSLIHEVLAWSQETLRSSAKKTIALGFPTYEDRTRLHQKKIENPQVVFEALKTLPPKNMTNLCLSRLEWLYYAGWTVDQADGHWIKAITTWRNNGCKKNKP